MSVAPHPTALTAPYWEACRRGELAIQRCAECRSFTHFPEPICAACGGERLAFEPVSGRGHVHTFSVVHRSFAPGFTDAGPYVIAWIDLVEQRGLRAFGNVRGCAVDEVHIGQPVTVCFEELDGFGPVPNWRAT